MLTSPPPSSGGIVLIEILNILSGYDLTHLNDQATADRSPAQVHYITEAFRRAYMDRADYLGDPDFNPHMPLAQMADPAYAEAWRKTIDPVKPSPSASLVRPAGFMPEPPKLAPIAPESNETTHFSVVDAQGNAVAMTYTLNFSYGNGMTVDKFGFLMNDEMDDFASKMGVPNGFGLIQGPANAIAPGKRPLSCMTPTIVSEPARRDAQGHLHPGKLRLVLGSPGWFDDHDHRSQRSHQRRRQRTRYSGRRRCAAFSSSVSAGHAAVREGVSAGCRERNERGGVYDRACRREGLQ